MASESPAAEFRVLGWHLVDMTGSHSSKWGAVLFLYLINGFKWGRLVKCLDPGSLLILKNYIFKAVSTSFNIY